MRQHKAGLILFVLAGAVAALGLASHGYEARYYGMKLRGYYLDHRGRIEDKEGNDRVVGYDLTAAVLDPHKMGFLEALASNSKSGSYLIG